MENINVTVHDKAKELFLKFRNLFIAESEGINNEMATTAALIAVKQIQNELNYYAGERPIPNEIRPIELSGKEFWIGVEKSLQSLSLFDYKFDSKTLKEE